MAAEVEAEADAEGLKEAVMVAEDEVEAPTQGLKAEIEAEVDAQ